MHGVAPQPSSLCRVGAKDFQYECIAIPTADCENTQNSVCLSCGLYKRDALPYVKQTDVHITQPGTAALPGTQLHCLMMPAPHPMAGCDGYHCWCHRLCPRTPALAWRCGTAPTKCGESVWDAAWDDVSRPAAGWSHKPIPTFRGSMHSMCTQTLSNACAYCGGAANP